MFDGKDVTTYLFLLLLLLYEKKLFVELLIQFCGFFAQNPYVGTVDSHRLPFVLGDG